MKPISARPLMRSALFLTVCFNSHVAHAAEIPVQRTLQIAQFGAVGDGKTDDTKALQTAFDALQSGDRLQLEAGKTYRHTDVLTIKNAGVHLSGASHAFGNE